MSSCNVKIHTVPSCAEEKLQKPYEMKTVCPFQYRRGHIHLDVGVLMGILAHSQSNPGRGVHAASSLLDRLLHTYR